MAHVGDDGGFESPDRNSKAAAWLNGTITISGNKPNSILPTSTQTPRRRPPPGRRRHFATSPTLYFFLSTLILSILSLPAVALQGHKFELRRPTLVARQNEIIFDPRPVPEPQLHRRQIDFGSTTSRKPSQATSTPSSTTSPTSSTARIEIAPTTSSAALPKVFDGGLGTNYTQPSCPNFLKQMIANDTFASCVPFSLLLENSMSFFSASRSPTTLDPVLSASCNIVLPACSSLMASYALTLRSNSACSDDYSRENPIVRQAYNGLLAYDILYRASCLKAQPTAQNNQSSDYCVTNAITNSSSPTDSYVYHLPLGVSLPAGSMPTCNQCLQDTMSIFATNAANKSQPISLTYIDAAQMINLQCGPGFVNQTVPGASGSGNKSAAPPSISVHVASVILLAGVVSGMQLFGAV